MNTKSTLGYCIELNDFEKLQGINKALFGDGTILHPDKRRDLANLMFVILEKAIPINNQDFSI